MKKILEVEETFLLKGRGLVVAPQIPVSQNSVFKPFQAIIEMVRPDGTSTTCQASFQLTHSLLYTRASDFRIDMTLLDVPKQQVPIVNFRNNTGIEVRLLREVELLGYQYSLVTLQ